MGAVKTGFEDVFRDDRLAGLPAAGRNKPKKADARALGETIEVYVDSMAEGVDAAAAAAAASATLAESYSDLAAAGASAANLTWFLYSGDGETSTFTLPIAAAKENTHVFIAGLHQNHDTYDVTGTTLDFGATPPAEGTDNIEVGIGGTTAAAVSIGAAVNVVFDNAHGPLAATNVQSALQEVAAADIETLDDLAAVNIPTARKTIRVAGHTTAGIGRINLVRSLASTPLQALDGSYWARSDETFSADQFGADPTGAVDASGAIQDAIDAMQAYRGGRGGTIYIPGGEYKIATSLVLPNNVDVMLARRATLKASAAMEAIIDTPLGVATRIEKGEYSGGVLNCNFLANRGVWPREFSGFLIDNVLIEDCDGNAIQAGDDDSDARSYELVATRVFTRSSRTGALVGDPHGIFFENCGDSHVSDSVFRGVRYGIGGEVSDSKFTRVHAWNGDAMGDIYAGFLVDGFDNVFAQCQVDGPFLDGWRIIQGGHSIIGCSVNYGAYGGIDDHGAAINVEAADDLTVMGCTFKGESSYRLRADIDGDLTNVRAWGNQVRHAVVEVGDLNVVP